VATFNVKREAREYVQTRRKRRNVTLKVERGW